MLIKRLLATTFFSGTLLLLAPLAVAQEHPPASEIVPTAEEPMHHVIAQTDDITLMRVLIPAGQHTLWHEQHLDYVNTAIQGTPVEIQYADKPTKDTEMITGKIRFGAHQGKPDTDLVKNTGKTVNHQVAFEIRQAGPRHFGPSDRSNVKGFSLVLDKPSVRGWHVHLEPGESTGEYQQSGPGVRVIFSGDRLLSQTHNENLVTTENIHPDDAYIVKPGKRRVINAGNKSLDFNEYELL